MRKKLEGALQKTKARVRQVGSAASCSRVKTTGAKSSEVSSFFSLAAAILTSLACVQNFVSSIAYKQLRILIESFLPVALRNALISDVAKKLAAVCGTKKFRPISD